MLAAPLYTDINTGQWISVLAWAFPKKLSYGSSFALVIYFTYYNTTIILNFFIPTRKEKLLFKKKNGNSFTCLFLTRPNIFEELRDLNPSD